MWNRSSLVVCLGVLAVVVAGCSSQGPDMATVTGTVTLDGQAVEGAGVVFTPEAGGLPANATTDASGKFELEALLGPNSVAVTKTKAAGGAGEELAEGDSPEDMGESADVEYLVPMKYGLPQTSGLNVDVAKGMDPVTLDLTSN